MNFPYPVRQVKYEARLAVTWTKNSKEQDSLRPAMSMEMSFAAPQTALPRAKRQSDHNMHGLRPNTSARAPLRG